MTQFAVEKNAKKKQLTLMMTMMVTMTTPCARRGERLGERSGFENQLAEGQVWREKMEMTWSSCSSTRKTKKREKKWG